MGVPAHGKSLTPAPNGADRIRADQWHLDYLDVEAAHRISQGEGVIVAIPDTGVDPHPDLKENLLPGTSLLPGAVGDAREDPNSHGTAMAGIIGAHGRPDKVGALGIAPRAQILPIRTSDADNEGNADRLAGGIEYAVAAGADVVSISGGGVTSSHLFRALRAARAADVVVVAAAGNRPDDQSVIFPASAEGVIAVGGIDRSGKIAMIAATGPQIDIAAPAVDIYSTGRGGRYLKSTGTSNSTAIVAGAVALIRAKYPHLPADEVVHRLTATAVDKGPPGRDDQYGYGVIDIVAALTADVPPLGFESATAAAPAARPTEAEAERSDSDRAATTRGLVTLGVIVAAGGAWAFIARRRRRSDDPPPRISR
ncbi:type VII secretion-associated serine protease mycosin [Micromonospora sp. WMMC415]|uniref:type VII secretion-associated serine protease mycosin n=1 Tax=Micromonospora sp. WMMC415 TaxID=2675222 RepID=UPI0012B4ECE7|nr:type VII secretion-associated serine protease mycosin [Micromonospora sp. WMMC415]QGN50546.1 type VII secretion-associated serine protease mycosin [Micromonospora sp. WMMC415]